MTWFVFAVVYTLIGFILTFSVFVYRCKQTAKEVGFDRDRAIAYELHDLGVLYYTFGAMWPATLLASICIGTVYLLHLGFVFLARKVV